VRPEHPLAALLPCDNVFAIESRWYRDNPLVIRGPGAGAMSPPERSSPTSTVWLSCCNASISLSLWERASFIMNFPHLP
jgi:aspartokinase/homoserine dehydrogenase 2